MATIHFFSHHLISPVPARTINKVTEDYQVRTLGFIRSNFENICGLTEVLHNYTQMKNSLNEKVLSDPDQYMTAA
jgi:hypothetical protein